MFACVSVGKVSVVNEYAKNSGQKAVLHSF